jgi:ferredoxin
MIVRILRQQCCGNAQCAEIAPNVFALDSQHKSVVLDPDGASREKLLEAAEACPTSAILIEEDTGDPVFP